MAQSPFPSEFAMGILQLSEQMRQKQAELSQIRQTQAMQAWLSKSGPKAFGSFGDDEKRRVADAQIRHLEAQTADIQNTSKLRFEQVKAEREATVARSISDFGRTGTAFIPSYAADRIPELMKSPDGAHITAIEMNGGTLLQRLSPEDSIKAKKIQADIDYRNSQIAVNHAKTKDLQAQEEARQQRIDLLGANVDLQTAKLGKQLYEADLKYAAALAVSLELSSNPAERARAARIKQDPAEAFLNEKGERSGPAYDRFVKLQEVVDATADKLSTGKGFAPRANLRVLDDLGVSHVLGMAPPTPSPSSSAPSTPSAPPAPPTFSSQDAAEMKDLNAKRLAGTLSPDEQQRLTALAASYKAMKSGDFTSLSLEQLGNIQVRPTSSSRDLTSLPLEDLANIKVRPDQPAPRTPGRMQVTKGGKVVSNVEFDTQTGATKDLPLDQPMPERSGASSIESQRTRDEDEEKKRRADAAASSSE